ncbi:ATP-dependent dethiobiotin synthetase BioD [Litchfieldella qijiaojingensis]|uniref:ATP-dependent dethiobiotin synthetase BioD n=1 Tax=Litchfieldella qijiaojingensis TaxID=980347 RepID=A0ABQ2YQE1_9GAMM|nr:dethiobiotin synthase [Halomonas qijiaojingensis]GGX90963.1 ATP-dependent dethiobiotin synthetase BioD [Halomonas qijiaojingensis]
MPTYFVTGTDTDAGKTLVSAALLAVARRQGLTTLGLKPVASGSEATPAGLRNIDALVLQSQSQPAVDYETVNPYAFAPAIAPHLAAYQAGQILGVEDLIHSLAAPLAERRDLTLIEGAGGWRVPLNDSEDLSDLAVKLDVPVILVVGLRLGAINHARLTLDTITAQGLRIAGWVANQIDPDIAARDGNLATLKHHLAAPCLGTLPYFTHGDTHDLVAKAAEYLRLPD